MLSVITNKLLKLYYEHNSRRFMKKYYETDIESQRMSGKVSRTKSNIVQLIKSTQPVHAGGRWAIVVFWSPKGGVCPTFSSLIDEFHAFGVNVLLVCNHALHTEQLEWAKNRCQIVAERNNEGFDIGAYKDCYLYLCEHITDINRLGFFNDSVFYIQRGLKAFVEKMYSGDTDVISAFENWDIHYHFQSFAVTLGPQIIRHPEVETFWREYEPISNRRFAIDQGEVAFSSCLLRVLNTSEVVYTVSRLAQAIERDLMENEGRKVKIFMPSYCLPNVAQDHIRTAMNSVLFCDASDEKRGSLSISRGRIYAINLYLEYLSTLNATHVGFWGFLEFLEAPLIKKDLVYRNIFDATDVSRMACSHTTDEELKIMETHYRKRGSGLYLKGDDLKLWQLGMK